MMRQSEAGTLPEPYHRFLAMIEGQVAARRIISDPLRTLAYGNDASFYRLVPKIVIRADNEAEVSLLLRAAAGCRVPVTFRAAGTSLSGQAVSDSVLIVAGDNWHGHEILGRHGYREAIIFGHALDGNLHFVFTQDFGTREEVERYGRLMDEVCTMVVEKYDGSLKAEHGTGRNMAPYVEMEWGREAYLLMQRIKEIFDPHGLLNPGVILNSNPQAHLEHLKPLAATHPLVDRCIECGFCEPVCPSKNLTLTPRQRITVQREISRLRMSAGAPEVLQALIGRYPVLCDTSPCLYRMRETMDRRLRLYEPVEFVHDFLLARLKIARVDETVTIHSTCSSEKLGLAGKLQAVAEACACRVVVPERVGCCGFAGDRGFTFPELNASALADLRPTVERCGCTSGYSNSRTCEIGLSLHSGVSYSSILSLVDRCSGQPGGKCAFCRWGVPRVLPSRYLTMSGIFSAFRQIFLFLTSLNKYHGDELAWRLRRLGQGIQSVEWLLKRGERQYDGKVFLLLCALLCAHALSVPRRGRPAQLDGPLERGGQTGDSCS